MVSSASRQLVVGFVQNRMLKGNEKLAERFEGNGIRTSEGVLSKS